MDDKSPDNESNEQQGLNKIDLSQLQNFSFGTQWTEVKSTGPAGRRERDFDRGDRRDRRDDGGRGGPAGAPARDRRGFRKPAGAPGAPGSEGAGGGAPGGGQGQRPFGGERREFRGGPGGQGGGGQGGERRDRPQGEGFRGGPRRDFRGGGERRDYRGEGGGHMERGPYMSPYFTATCYPEDVGFAALVKAVRASCRTFQLFEITKAVLEKNDRFVVVLQRKAAPERPGSEGGAEGTEPAKAAKPAPIYMSVPDHLPFDTEEAAIQHVLKNHLDQFFTTEDIEVEPPKGNFPIINKCGITGELLGPPNHHLYQQTLQQHHATKLGRMPFDRFRESITSVREPEVVQAWLDKMKKATRYTWKTVSTPAKPTDEKPAAKPGEASAPVSETAPAADVPAAAPDAAAPAADAAPTAEPAAPAPAAPSADAAPAESAPAAAKEGPSFTSFDEAKGYLMTHARDKVVRAFDNVRFHGKLIEKLPPGEIKRAIEGHVERQRRFPLDTANALRGRLRREGFTIFKKGSRGVSYVCAVKRRFRVPGQVFSETITALIDFIEKNPLVPVKELPQKFLGIDVAAATAAAAAAAPEGTPASQSPFAALPADQAEKLRKMTNDLRWLVMEGYVTEFSDGKLFAPPPMSPQAGKKADEHGEEHDPVDFPEAPAAAAAAPAPTASPEAPPAEAAASEEPVANTDAATSEVAAEQPANEGGEPVKPDSTV